MSLVIGFKQIEADFVQIFVDQITVLTAFALSPGVTDTVSGELDTRLLVISEEVVGRADLAKGLGAVGLAVVYLGCNRSASVGSEEETCAAEEAILTSVIIVAVDYFFGHINCHALVV